MNVASSPVSADTAHALHLMLRVVSYAETVHLIPSVEGGVSVEGFKRVLRELAHQGVAQHEGQLDETTTVHDFERAADVVLTAIEDSPLPHVEWQPISDIMGDELAPLLRISQSSLVRYRSGERKTPDAVADRLHEIALLVSDLSGSYNDFGIRRWFRRRRTALGGRSPREILDGNWGPDSEGVAEVRRLARRLIGAAAA